MPRALAVLLLLCACQPSGGGYDVLELGALPEAPDTPPAWAAEAVWTQLTLVPDTLTSPTSVEPSAPPDSTSAPDPAPDSTALRLPDAPDEATEADTADMPGTSDEPGPPSPLQRALDDIDRVAGFGVTALAVLPSMAEPVHIDPALGPDPEGDREMIALEDPDDPATWSTTAADGLFLDLIEHAHERGLRVALGASLGRLSEESGRSAGDMSAGTSRALAAAIRWLDPDGDGDPADGVDGFIVEGGEAPPPFWGDLRRLTKAVHPEAILVGLSGEPLEAGLDVALDARPLATLAEMLGPSPSALSPMAAARTLADHYASVPADRLPAQLSVPPGSSPLPDLASGSSRLGRSLGDARADELLLLLQATLPGAPLVDTGRDAIEAGRPGPSLSLRRDHPDLWARGTLTWEPSASVLRFTRRAGDAAAVVVVNVADVPQQAVLPAGRTEVALAVGPRPIGDGRRHLLAPRSGAVFLVDSGRSL